MTSSPMTEKEIAFINSVKEQINSMVDEKMIARSKFSPNVSRAAIEKECEASFFKELEKGLEEEMKFFTEFFEFVRHENPQLVEKIDASTQTNLEINSFADILNAPQVKLDGSIIKELNDLGHKWFTEAKYDQAFRCFSYLTQNDSSNPDFWLMRGLAAHNLLNFPEAIASYLNTINIVPHYAYAYIELINCLMMAKEIEAAKDFFKTFIQEVPASEYADSENAAKVEELKKVLQVS